MKLTLYADGGARGNPGHAGAGAVLFEGTKKIAVLQKYLGHKTNNQAEYAAVVLGLTRAVELGASEIEVYLDSKLIVEQLSGRYRVKHPELKPLAEKAHACLQKFQKWSFHHIPREQNYLADDLANLAMDSKSY